MDVFMLTKGACGLSGIIDEILTRKNASGEFIVGNVTLDYGELRSLVNRTLNLFDSCGLSTGDRIVVACADDLNVSVLYIAALRFGLCTAVIDPMSSALEAAKLIGAVEPKASFMDESLARETSSTSSATIPGLFVISESGKPPSGGGLRNLVTLKKHTKPTIGEDFRRARRGQSEVFAAPPLFVAEDSTALVLFTSGTTSRPKGVEVTFGNLLAQFETLKRQYGFDESSRILNHLPLHHTDGLNQGPAIALFCGACWIRPSISVAQNLDVFLGFVRQQCATHIITVPTVLALIDQLPSEYDDTFETGRFSFIGSTASYLDETLWRRFETRFGVMLVNSYGLTETVSEALYCGPDKSTRRVGSVGRPVDCEARIVDGDGRDVPVETVGELILRGTNVFKGYLNDPEATNEVLKDGWFFTGDLAEEDGDGFFYIVGRKKNMIIRAGINVYPDDVTNTVMELDEVLEATTIGLDDPILGQRVVTCITPSRSHSHEGIAELVALHCKTRLGPERRPDRILIFNSFPRGPSGKVILNKLREMALDEPVLEMTGSFEEQVIGIAASILSVPVDSLSRNTSFESLEVWDSLAHLALISAFEKQFSVTFGVEDIMSMSDLSRAITLISQKRQR